jgi:anti-sigma regulatory factor (Ser/Thr protein kinase)
MPHSDNDCGFQHEAFFYANAEELLAGTVPFLRAGFEAGEAILVAMPPAGLDLLRGELNGEAESIQFVNMEELGRNPARIISAWRDFVGSHLTGDGGVRGIGEPIWAGRSPAELEECVRHEALLNLAFADSPAWSLLCPYNAAELDERLLESAEHNHPRISGAGGQRPSDAFADPMHNGGPFAGDLRPPADVIGEWSFQPDQLGELRGYLAEHARCAGLDAARASDLVLAASEVATNSVLHGGGSGTLRVWRDDGCIGCDIRDEGRIDEPLVGRQRPDADQLSGRGIWLANQLCDLVQIRSAPTGSIVRLQMSAQPPSVWSAAGRARDA